MAKDKLDLSRRRCNAVGAVRGIRLSVCAKPRTNALRIARPWIATRAKQLTPTSNRVFPLQQQRQALAARIELDHRTEEFAPAVARI